MIILHFKLCVVDHVKYFHDDVIKWKYFRCYWLFVRGIHWPPVDSPHRGQCHGALMFSLICACTNGWANTQDAGDSRRHRVHYDVTVMLPSDKLIHWKGNKCDHFMSLTAQEVGKMTISGAVSDEISRNWRHFRFSVWRKFKNNTCYTDIPFYFQTKTYQDSRPQQWYLWMFIYQSCKHRLKTCTHLPSVSWHLSIFTLDTIS